VPEQCHHAVDVVALARTGVGEGECFYVLARRIDQLARDLQGVTPSTRLAYRRTYRRYPLEQCAGAHGHQVRVAWPEAQRVERALRTRHCAGTRAETMKTGFCGASRVPFPIDVPRAMDTCTNSNGSP
jgi:hypothetical protein